MEEIPGVNTQGKTLREVKENLKVKIKNLLTPYFEKEVENSPYEEKEEYIAWMRIAGYGDWQKMGKAKPRCQKMMTVFKKKL